MTRRLRRLGWWIHDIPAAVTYRARMRRMTHAELLELVHEAAENFSHLGAIADAFKDLVDVLDARLEHLIIVTGGPRHG